MNSMTRACSQVADLLFPRGCAGCDRPDDVLCEDCMALFSRSSAQTFDGVAMGSWFACGWYRGTVRQAVLAWKDMGMRNVTGRFLKPYADLLKHLASLISFTTDKTLTVPFSWFRHRRRTLRCGVEDEGT